MSISKDGWNLVWQASNGDAEKGEVITCFRGEHYILMGGNPPHKPSSTGRVWVKDYDDPSYTQEYFPSVFGLKWIEQE